MTLDQVDREQDVYFIKLFYAKWRIGIADMIGDQCEAVWNEVYKACCGAVTMSQRILERRRATPRDAQEFGEITEDIDSLLRNVFPDIAYYFRSNLTRRGWLGLMYGLLGYDSDSVINWLRKERNETRSM